MTSSMSMGTGGHASPQRAISLSRSSRSCSSYCFSCSLMTGSVSKGAPASVHSAHPAAAMPNTAGVVPSTGMVRTRKLGTTWKSAGLRMPCSTSSQATSPQRGFSVESSTGTPVMMLWSLRSLYRSALASGSHALSPRSTMCRRVGSALAPAPATERHLMPRFTHAATSATLVSMLSMASMTSVGLPASSSLSLSAVYIWTTASTSASGKMRVKCLARQVAFGVPTSSRVATAWRLSEDTVTWSKSIRRSLPTPERSSRCAQCDPTPPSPTTTTNDSATSCCASAPKN
mmetsp:Transcript_28877/g.73715  ORF Transcript_28877/g.73715 Transcript_28877/m.73715 type:complete len:288 (+) Transcript_28877:754-1617(+)